MPIQPKAWLIDNTQRFKLSTNNKPRIPLKKLLVNALMDVAEPPPVESLNLLLALRNTSIPKFAEEIGKSPQAIYEDIKGGKKCPAFRDAFSKALGFNPWAS